MLCRTQRSADMVPVTKRTQPGSFVRAAAAPVVDAAEQPQANMAGARLWQLGAAAIGGTGADARAAAGLLLDLSLTLTWRFAVVAQLSGETALSARDLADGRRCSCSRGARLPQMRGCAGPELAGVLANGSGFQMNKSAFVTAAGALVRVWI
jgi:hypothetical protein